MRGGATNALDDSTCIENSVREVLLRTVSSMSEQDERHSSGNISRASSAVDLLTLDLRKGIPDTPNLIPDTPQHHAAARALDMDDDSVDADHIETSGENGETDSDEGKDGDVGGHTEKTNVIVGLSHSAPASPADVPHEREDSVPVGIVDYCLLIGMSSIYCSIFSLH